MFVLDKNIKSGVIKLWNKCAQSGKVTNLVTPASGKATNSSTYVYGGGSGYDAAWYFSQSSNILTWTRMSDGTLIMSRNSGVGVSPYSHGEDQAKIHYGTKATKDNNTNPSGLIMDFYQNATIDGTPVKLTLFSPDFKGHYSKYIQPTSGANWDTEGANRRYTDYIGKEKNVSPWWYRFVTVMQGSKRDQDTMYSEVHGDGQKTLPDVEFRLIGIPRGTAPKITPDIKNVGTISEPIVVPLTVAGSPTATISVDDGPAEPLEINSGSFGLDLSKWWGSIGLGAHTLFIRAEQGGVKTGAKISFTKSTSTCSVTLKAHEALRRPSIVTIADNCVVPGGAIITREVTNNALDDTPSWETYAEGTQHAFANKTKTAEQWATAARITIDNSHGSSRASINTPVTMAVMYEGAE